MNKIDFLNTVRPFTMTSDERIEQLYNSLEYIRLNDIPGDFVECGVWKGGNILGIMEYLNYYNLIDRNIWMYDTFSGMTQPTEVDKDYQNNSAYDIFDSVVCLSPIDEVKENLNLSTFNKDSLRWIVGDVCTTLDSIENLPKKISLLRLDTDWYDSTKKELEILYPLLVNNGVLIIDDYGHWQGCKKAVDEYFRDMTEFKTIDYTGILKIKK